MNYQPSQKSKETIKHLVSLDKVQKALSWIEQDHERTIQQQIELCLIPAPTFHEENKAKRLAEMFKEAGLSDVTITPYGNVTGVRKGKSSERKVVLDGHMDTVYPLDTPLNLRRDEEFVYLPGIADDTRALAAELTVIRALNEANIETEKDLIFLGSVEEEGKGGFGGIRNFLDGRDDVDACICIDGDGSTGIIYQATGFKTIEVTFYGASGHAFAHFGELANPLHAAARAVAKISDIQVPQEPKTTFCVSNFHAGNDAGIHAFASEAIIKINYRSNGQKELEELDQKIMKAIDDAAKEETARWNKNEITYTIKTWVDVGAGSLDEHDEIVETTWCAIEAIGNTPDLRKGGPTNASIPICKGIPAVCIGAGNTECFVHNAEKERFPVKESWKMPQLALILALSMAKIVE
ncbi:MAG: M20/M25/M40 family metallo-hydrolase [Erysipelotrichaceae bacterium]|nr:M20/M25/M40 family metallo-hydrolase [Erysipelotrichaceae bacterium]